MTPYALTTEQRTEPLGIDDTRPGSRGSSAATGRPRG